MARLFLLFVCAALTFGAGGCATASIATASTLAGIAATGISTGADVYRMGKLDSADLGTFEQWTSATRAAAGDLGLKIERDETYGEGKWRCYLADDHQTHSRVYIERRTPKLCRIRVDVGVLGSEPTARLLLARIRQHVPNLVGAAAPPHEKS